MELALAASSWAETGPKTITVSLERTIWMQDVIWYTIYSGKFLLVQIFVRTTLDIRILIQLRITMLNL